MTNPKFTRSSKNKDRLSAALAGYSDSQDELAHLLQHPEPQVRASSLRSLHRLAQLSVDQVALGLADSTALVRCTAAELGAKYPQADLIPMLSDPDPRVVEIAAWSLGEHQVSAHDRIKALIKVSEGHDSALCRESAVAALGAIGDERGLHAILEATKDRATVRRRAIISLAPFSGPEVDAALQKALKDRDWQVRQAAEDQLNISP